MRKSPVLLEVELKTGSLISLYYAKALSHSDSVRANREDGSDEQTEQQRRRYFQQTTIFGNFSLTVLYAIG